MMTKNADKKREQILMFCMDDIVPQDHMLRLIDQAIDWSFIYDLVEDKYIVQIMAAPVWIRSCSLKFHSSSISTASKACARQ